VKLTPPSRPGPFLSDKQIPVTAARLRQGRAEIMGALALADLTLPDLTGLSPEVVRRPGAGTAA
jgi:hypothetical protein